MTIYYVDPSASPGGTGLTQSDPLDSPPALDTSYDTVLFRRGTTYTPEAATPSYGLRIEAGGIRVGAYGVGPAPKINGANVNHGVHIETDVAGWTIEDVEIYNVLASTNRRGIFQTTTGDSGTIETNGTLRRVTVHGVRSETSSIDAICVQMRGKGNVYQDVHVYDSGNDGFWHNGRNALFSRCRVHHIGQDQLDSSIHPDCIQLTGHCGGTIIEDCVLDPREKLSTTGSQCIIYSAANEGNITIRGNRIWQLEEDLHFAVLVECDDAKISSNFIMGGTIGIALSAGSGFSGAEVCGNIVINLTNIGINVNHAASKIYNNTVVGGGPSVEGPTGIGTGIRHGVSEAATEIYNNIVVDKIRGFVRSNSSVVDYNCAYNCGTAFNSSTLNNITTDPLLAPDYSLREGSPCIGTGFAKPGLLDFRGRPIYGPPDMGAVQYRHRSYQGYRRTNPTRT